MHEKSARRGVTSANLARSVLDASHYRNSGVSAEAFRMPRCALLEGRAFAQPQPLTIGFDKAYPLAVDVESMHISWQRWRVAHRMIPKSMLFSTPAKFLGAGPAIDGRVRE